MLTLHLTLEEARELRRLLEEHQYYGWIFRSGEFDIVASWEASPTLTALGKKLKEVLKQTQTSTTSIPRVA